MEKEAIINAYPSICYDCAHARRPWAKSLRDKGYVGCVEYLRKGQDTVDFIGPATELATGWIDLRSGIFNEKTSGILTNEQLMTLEVKSCKSYRKNE